MATVLSGKSLVDLLLMLGVDSNILHGALNQGMLVTLENGTTLRAKNSTYDSSITIKPKHISMAKEGVLGPATKMAIKYQVQELLTAAVASSDTPLSTAFKKASSATEKLAEVFKEVDEVFPDTSFDPKKHTCSEPFPSQAAKTAKGPTIPFDDGVVPASVFNEPKVPLIEAKALYQPVTATSQGSTYHVLAFLDGAVIAARYLKDSGKLSIRIEGTSLPKYKAALVDFGFSDGNSYMSVHFNIPAMVNVRRTFGALLLSLPVGCIQRSGDPEFIADKGN